MNKPVAGRGLGSPATMSLLAAALCLSLFSCSARDSGVSLEPTPVLSDGIGWGVVTLAYARLKAEPGFSAPDGGYARLGEVVELQSRFRSFSGPDRGVWYRISAGGTLAWLHESALQVHDSRARAENAAGGRP